MRINKFIAQATGLSRRAADAAIIAGEVLVNGRAASTGHDVTTNERVQYGGRAWSLADLPGARDTLTIMFNKPVGCVVSRDGQGSKTIYDLLPPHYRQLKPVGRLDKDSSGLLLLTNDGDLANQLTHPRYRKTKVYELRLDKPLQPLHRQMVSDHGIMLEDGRSQLLLDRLAEGDDHQWQVTMHEGRNRQIRRTFAALGYNVVRLHRVRFGSYDLGNLAAGETSQA